MARDITTLRSTGVRGILDIGSDNRLFFPGIRYSRFEIDNTDDAPLEKFFDAGIQFIDLVREDGCVLLICKDGRSLGPSILAAWFIKKFKLPLVSAMAMVRQAVPNACPNDGFIRKLDAWYYQQLGDPTENCAVSNPNSQN